MTDITLIGTAALLPIPERALTAVLLTCNGRSILFDCGEGTQTAARKAGVSLMHTDIIALTHYHGDHIFGLPGLLETLSVADRTTPLYITGPEGLREVIKPILQLTGPTTYPTVLLELAGDELPLSTLIDGWPTLAKLAAFKTEHRVPSQGYCFTLGRAGKFLPHKAEALGVPVNQWSRLQKGQRVQIGDKIFLPDQVLTEPRRGLKFVFTGDTAVCDNLIAAAHEADLLISDATYGDNAQAQQATDYGHMTFAQAAHVARQAGVKRLWLAHYSQTIKNPQLYLSNATEIFPNTICGFDGLSTTLRFEI